MRASQFIDEAIDSDAVNELDSFIQNDKIFTEEGLCQSYQTSEEK